MQKEGGGSEKEGGEKGQNSPAPNQMSTSTSSAGLDTSKGGKPVSDPRMPSDPGGQDADKNKSVSSGQSANDSNESILMQSGVVRLQQAARAELQRRNEKKIEEAAAAEEKRAAEEKGAGANMTRRQNRNKGSANGLRENTGSNALATTNSDTKTSPVAASSSTQGTSAINSSWMKKASRGSDEDDDEAKKIRSIISLDQLNRNIDKRLNSRDKLFDSRASMPRVEGTVKPPVRDTMSSLLSYNHIRGDWRRHQSASTYNGKFHFASFVFSGSGRLIPFFKAALSHIFSDLFIFVLSLPFWNR